MWISIRANHLGLWNIKPSSKDAAAQACKTEPILHLHHQLSVIMERSTWAPQLYPCGKETRWNQNGFHMYPGCPVMYGSLQISDTKHYGHLWETVCRLGLNTAVSDQAKQGTHMRRVMHQQLFRLEFTLGWNWMQEDVVHLSVVW